MSYSCGQGFLDVHPSVPQFVDTVSAVCLQGIFLKLCIHFELVQFWSNVTVTDVS